MNRLGLLLALLGLGLAVWLIAAQDLAAVLSLLAGAGWALLLIPAAHLLVLAPNAWAWALTMPGRQRPGLPAMTALVWIRQSVNTLLPVGRVGGEIACYRLLRGRGVAPAPAAGGLLVDMGLSAVALLGFVVLGLVLLAGAGHAPGWPLVAGLVLGALLLAVPFIALQNARLAGRAAAWLNRLGRGRFPDLGAQSRRLDRYMRHAWRHPRLLLRAFLWQLLGNILGAVQIWLALRLLGHPVSWPEAIAIEALVQAIAAFGFAVPGGLGVLEAGFLGVGALMGIDPATSAALALTRRLRELLLSLPGLLAWVLEERRLSRD